MHSTANPTVHDFRILIIFAKLGPTENLILGDCKSLIIRKISSEDFIVKMENKLTFSYSATDFEEFLNSSNTTTEPTFIKETFKWTNGEIARLIQLIFRPILVIVGTVGNGLAIYIMRKTSLKHLSTCFYMFVLALADSGKLISIRTRNLFKIF